MLELLETDGAFADVLLQVETADALASVVASGQRLPGIPVTVEATAVKEYLSPMMALELCGSIQPLGGLFRAYLAQMKDLKGYFLYGSSTEFMIEVVSLR